MMSSREILRKGVAQGGRPLRRQPTGLPVPAGQPGSRPKRTTASRKLHKQRSMRIPAIENDMMNRIGVSKKRKAIARAASTKAGRSSSPYKSLLVGMARTGDDDLRATSDAEVSSSNSIVRCASPSPFPESPTSPSSPRPASPQLPKLPAPSAEAKGKKQRSTRECPVVLRPLPSRVAASSSHSACSLAAHQPPRTPPVAPAIPEARRSGTPSSGASRSPRSGPSPPYRRSPLAVAPRLDDPPPTKKSPSVSEPVAAVSDDIAQPRKVQGEGVSTVPCAPCVNSSDESDSQSEEELSISDATSHENKRVGSSVSDASAADAAQAAAMKQSLLSQIEERNGGRKWDDLLGFLHDLAPTEIGGLLKTATRAGRRALRRLAGKETGDSDNSNGEDDTRVLGRARQSRRQGESVLSFDDAGSDGEAEEASAQTIVPPRRRRFLYKAKGVARAGSPSPPLPLSPSPVFVPQTAAAGSSRASNRLSASASSPTERKRTRSPESAPSSCSSEPPTKRQKKEGDTCTPRPRPLRREGAFIFGYSAPAPMMPAQSEDAHQNDDGDGDGDDDKYERQTVHANLIKSFLDQIQDLDISSWLLRGSVPARDEKNVAEDESAERYNWMLRADLQEGARAGEETDALDGATPHLGQYELCFADVIDRRQ